MTKKFEEQILDKLDHALLVARQSTPNSLSPILKELAEKIDDHIITHEADVKSIKDDIALLKISVEPAVSAIDTANSMKRGVTWMAGFILAIGTLTGAVVLFKDWLKR